MLFSVNTVPIHGLMIPIFDGKASSEFNADILSSNAVRPAVLSVCPYMILLAPTTSKP